MKYLVTYICTNCYTQKYCNGMLETEADHFNGAAKNARDAIAAACGIEDNRIQIRIVEQLADNPVTPEAPPLP